jgi:hypothetical protein
MTYQIGCTRQRVSCRSKSSSSLGPPANRETTTAAISGPKGTKGLLVGFKITNGQSAHNSRYARAKYSSRSWRAAQFRRSVRPVPGRGRFPDVVETRVLTSTNLLHVHDGNDRHRP